MDSYSLLDLKKACEKYLREMPNHAQGFCWWAYRESGAFISDYVYEAISPYFREYQRHHPEIGASWHVSRRMGCVPERMEFVAWMLEQVKKDLEEEQP